ncbi:PREDICTED: nodal modulator 3 [Ceratosolen solmsi marchali]|uniref:Nodal modulator 3 n=1 Tax=Ceratosolen solmsi marchali TaxID=326594 RepID=A0AAJ7DXT8_9HYME|nr:PREDICTED: nodal modulator 3 [Ceratosolen solmsi marchali]
MSFFTSLLFSKLGLVLIVFLLVQRCRTDEILGCGGFMKSHADIDFSQITVKLYTKSGSLKDQTECAPNTGYYFLPVYDKGEYLLKLEPPRGWSFEPTKVILNIDGSNSDLCSQGKDINFIFKGFGITGKVITAASSKTIQYPKGISILLYDKSNKTLLASTVTLEGGTFSFTPVQPGKYVLVASHPTWLMDKHSTTVTVREGNTELKDGELSVFGFDVSGRVTTIDGEPVGRVSFLLFGNGRGKNCATSSVEGFDSKKKPLCHVTSDETGRFLFPALSPGDYILIPYYAGSRTKFDVKPSELPFTVNQDSLILSQEFKVTGFTISGKVMASINPLIPLAGAKVYLSNKQIAITDNNGAYKTDNVKAKQYMLHAEANDMQFEEKLIKISPSNPELPVITPIAYKVFGKVSSTTKENIENRKILIKNMSSNNRQEVEIDSNTGEWTVYLPPAKYQLNVIVNDEEKTKGLQFFPLQRVIDLVFAPLKDVNFLQLKATLKGAIICLPNKDSIDECTQTQITLKMVDGIVETKTVKAKAGEYIFEDVLPGQYEVIVDTDIFCWDKSSHQIVIASEKPVNEPVFWQTGFSVTFISSHDTKLAYSVPNQPNKKMYFQLVKGSTRHCIPVSGKYDFHPKGCHKYSKSVYTWNTNERTPIILSSTEHLQKGIILSPIAIDGVSVRIEAESEAQIPIVLSDLKPIREGQLYKYIFSFNAISGEKYVISPSSEVLLFDPSSLKITGPDDCENDITIFRAEQGKIISGFIHPLLEGVAIKIFGNDKEVPIHTLVTQQDGTFKVGPLDGRIDYSITAEKEGFILTRDHKLQDYKFLARKLAEINVKVIDASESIPLQGVLLSLSGGGGGPNSYRKNIMTGEEGTQIFNSLSPGDYYLRPTMKEYRFESSSKMIRVEEGKTVSVTFIGRRVAFSAYGVVTCLNGEPEAGLLVEARGQNDCADLQEEATTKDDGTWRIRGLEPKCIYAIRLKLNEQNSNSRNLRAIPSSIAVQATQDIHDIKLMALQPVSRTDVSIRIISNQLENYRTLKVKLCREDIPDSPIHIAKIESQYFGKMNNAGFLLHFPPLQADGKKYFIQLESSLSKLTHEYKIFPVYFEANSSFKFVDLRFDAVRKHEQGDANQITFVPLPLIILVTIAFFHREALCGWLNTTIEKWYKRPSSSLNRNSQGVPNLLAATDSRADDIIVEQIKNINSKSSKKLKPRKT